MKLRTSSFCHSCDGQGDLACESCEGAGTFTGPDNRTRACLACTGSGHLRCRACSGQGAKRVEESELPLLG
jgi:DnaJ-class molecular chaperone